MVAAYYAKVGDGMTNNPDADKGLWGVGLYVDDSNYPYRAGLYLRDQGSGPLRYNIYSLGTASSGVNLFQGPVWAQQGIRTNETANTDLAGSGAMPFSFTFAEQHNVAPFASLRM